MLPADPHPAFSRGSQLVPGPLPDHLTFELRKTHHHVQAEPARACTGIEVLGHTDEMDVVFVEKFEQMEEVEKRPAETIILVYPYPIDFTGFNILEQSFEGGAIHIPTRVAPIVVVAIHRDPTFMLLAEDIGFYRLTLGMQGVEFLIEAFLRAFPGIDGDSDLLFGLIGVLFSPRFHFFPRFLNPKNRGPDHAWPVMARAVAERLE